MFTADSKESYQIRRGAERDNSRASKRGPGSAGVPPAGISLFCSTPKDASAPGRCARKNCRSENSRKTCLRREVNYPPGSERKVEQAVADSVRRGFRGVADSQFDAGQFQRRLRLRVLRGGVFSWRERQI